MPDEAHPLRVVVSDKTQRPVSGMKFQSHGLHLLGAGEQDLLPVQREEIRALPHFSVLVMAGVQGADERPLPAVPAAVEQDGPAAVCGAVADDGVIRPVCLPPDLGVPEVHRTAALRQILAGQDRVQLAFVVIHAVSNGDALGLDIPDKSIGIVPPLNAGIHEHLPSVGHLHRAAGEASRRVVAAVRSQGGGQTLPADQVPALYMSPVHGAPLVGVGVVLVKQMVLPLIEGESVGVVHPADGGGNVEGGPFPGGDAGAVLDLKIPGLLQRFAGHIVFPPGFFQNVPEAVNLSCAYSCRSVFSTVAYR